MNGAKAVRERGGLGPLAARMTVLIERSMADPWRRGQVEGALADAMAWRRLAWDEAGALVGLVLGRRVAADLVEIDLVAVEPAARRRGWGRRLLGGLARDAGAVGVRELRLELAESNAPARALYEGLGFVVVGRRPRYYPDGDGALLLTLRLDADSSPRPSDPEDRLTAQHAPIASAPAEHAPIRGHGRVVANEATGSGFRLRLAVPDWPGSTPGQFVMVGAGVEGAVPRRDPLLPRPMALYRERGADGEGAGVVELLYRVVGRGTRLLADAKPGETVSLVGPLGRGFPVDPDGGAALLVGGGTGIASLHGLARALAAAGRPVTVLLGARSAADLIGREDFEALGHDGVELICATEDGSVGVKGLVTEPLRARLAAEEAPATVFAVGPTPMMRACGDLAAAFGAACLVSLENPMACGFGVCLGCAAPRRQGGFSLVCRAGPVFDAREIAWEGLP